MLSLSTLISIPSLILLLKPTDAIPSQLTKRQSEINCGDWCFGIQGYLGVDCQAPQIGMRLSGDADQSIDFNTCYPLTTQRSKSVYIEINSKPNTIGFNWYNGTNCSAETLQPHLSFQSKSTGCVPPQGAIHFEPGGPPGKLYGQLMAFELVNLTAVPSNATQSVRRQVSRVGKGMFKKSVVG